MSLTIYVPIIEARTGHHQLIRYVPIAIGYPTLTPEKSKPKLATELFRKNHATA